LTVFARLHLGASATALLAVEIGAGVAILVLVNALGEVAFGAGARAFAMLGELPLILCGGLCKFAHFRLL
jgi:hypothetical protein